MKQKVLIQRAWVVLTILALSLVSCGGGPGTLTGTVTRMEDGKPVAGAEIMVFELEKVKGLAPLDTYQKTNPVHREATDAQGTFSVSLAPARYLVEVRIRGEKVASRLVEVKAGRTTAADFGLTLPSP